VSEANQTAEEGKPLQSALATQTKQERDRERRKLYLRYICPSCDEAHRNEYDAEHCCTPSVDSAYVCPECEAQFDDVDTCMSCEESHRTIFADPLSESMCPICRKRGDSIRDAIDCCLFIRLSWAERDQLARDVQFGRHDPAAYRMH
jgi:hypothetical protein